MLWAMDQLGWVVGAALVLVGLFLYVRTRQAADVGPRSTPAELDADLERDLEIERLGTRPKA